MLTYSKTFSLLLSHVQAREFLNSLGELSQTHIFAKIESIEVTHSWSSLDRTVAKFGSRQNTCLITNHV